MDDVHANPDSQNHNAPSDNSSGTTATTVPESQTRLRKPSFYKVVLLNDDYTPMDFVVHILQKFFQKSFDQASRVMLQVHQEGAGIAGVFTYEIAETKVFVVNQYAKQHKYPLKSTLEKA